MLQLQIFCDGKYRQTARFNSIKLTCLMYMSHFQGNKTKLVHRSHIKILEDCFHFRYECL